MQITNLGHSCLLLTFMDPKTHEHTRILIDPWLSDHATGDSMGRFPRLRFDFSVLKEIHAIFISHAHCDHLDPYTLVRIWKELPNPPILFIPVGLDFLQPVFRTYLNEVDIRLLKPHTNYTFRGLELLGFFDVGLEPTNEDDVMVLVITNGSERVLIEADARLSLELPNFRKFISMLMRRPDLESAIYLTTENELLGTLESRNCRTINDRENLQAYAFDDMLQSVYQLYVPVDDPEDIWQGDRVLRLIHGQGLTVPHDLHKSWSKILFPVCIEDRVQAEQVVASEQGKTHTIDRLQVGYIHTIERGIIENSSRVSGIHILDQEEDRDFCVVEPFFPSFPCAPLRFDIRDIQHQRNRILNVLNNRFLPYLHGLRRPPILHLLSEYDGAYRIRIHYGNKENEQAYDYELSYKNNLFVEKKANNLLVEQESYWANDLEDFLDGRCDEFTTFCRKQFPVEEMRLWVCLSTPILNSDLVSKRVQLHFERATKGLCPGSWVMEFYTNYENTDSC